MGDTGRASFSLYLPSRGPERKWEEPEVEEKFQTKETFEVQLLV